MAGIAITIILVAMASSWLLRRLLLNMLQERHPEDFAALGFPTHRQLASFYPQYREMQIRFWKYLWGGKIFRINDKLLSRVARSAQIADIALAAGALLLFWAAGHSR